MPVLGAHIRGGPFSRSTPLVNTQLSPSQMVVDEALSGGKVVKYETERGDEVAFLFCQAGRIEKFVNGRWEHGSTSLTYTAGEGALRDCFGFCGVPKVAGPDDLKSILQRLAQLYEAAGVIHNLNGYQSTSDEWWSAEELAGRDLPSAALPEACERQLPSGKLDDLYRGLLASQSEDEKSREVSHTQYRNESPALARTA
eukprot:TRINITY_DN6236_c2_g1_i1.p1 TRINITY_DN6236_c2_g1~~TRINITY_DN6236_c2_g1_i1.p1  ORF type:complete len:199 (+),score=51.78 TRINITY_DN6236_c2_g1_i1:61-657(+)